MILAFLVAAHASWVYRIDGRPLADSDVPSLLAFAKSHQLDELYVSLGALPLDAEATPRVLKALKAAALRVEALIDAPDPAPLIDKILAYNEAHKEARFDGVHYDFEPWIGKGNDTSWADKLLTSYRAAKKAAGSLPLSVDVSGAKLAQLTPDKRKEVLEAAGRAVSMEYESPMARVETRAEGHFGQGAKVMLALRVKDFGCAGINTQVDALEKKFRGKRDYAGWAIYDYNTYLKTCR